MSKPISNKILFQSVRSLIQEAQQHVVRNVNTTMLITYFEIGRIIIEHDQKGKPRAGYAEETLMQLSKDLTKEFGKGYSRSNLEYMRSFYTTYKKRIPQSVIGKSTKDKKSQSSEENSTIGIILCKEENKTVVEFTLPENNNQIFAKAYKQILPSKEDLKKQLHPIKKNTKNVFHKSRL